MTHGIYPVGRAHEVDAAPVINDNYRFDGHSDSTSLSIGFSQLSDAVQISNVRRHC